MRDIATKESNVGDVLHADAFNSIMEELENTVISTGISLDPNIGPDTDLNMLGKTAAIYSGARKLFYDSSVSGDDFTLEEMTGYTTIEMPTAYNDGMTVIFKTNRANTGAVTIDLGGLGAKDAQFTDGSALTSGLLEIDTYYLFVFNETDDRFEYLEGIEFATDAEAAAATLENVAISPSQLTIFEMPGIIKSSTSTIRTGYLPTYGQEVSRTTYANLFEAIGIRFGAGDGSTTFNLPYISNDFNSYADLNASLEDWRGIWSNPVNSDVFICSDSEQNVYKLTGGTGSWVDQSAPAEAWEGVAVNSNTSDVYIISNNLYKQVGGTGSWVDQSAGLASQNAISVNSINDDVYIVGASTIYKQTGGTGSFVEQGSPAVTWSGVSISDSTGDVWVISFTGVIYKQTAGTGSWVLQTAPSLSWDGISADQSSEDVYAVGNGAIYKSIRGENDFLLQSYPVPAFSTSTTDIRIGADGDIYVCGTGQLVEKAVMINHLIKT